MHITSTLNSIQPLCSLCDNPNERLFQMKLAITLPPRFLFLRANPAAIGETLASCAPMTPDSIQALVISLRQIPSIEDGDIRALEKVVGKLRAYRISTLIIEASAQVKASLIQCKLLDAMGPNSYFDDLDSATAGFRSQDGNTGQSRPIVISLFAESMLAASVEYFRLR